ncbi:hypothetical protein CsatA_005015 [Cannabis sativa]
MTPNIKYDVFISFRGEDTRNNFTSHLEKALSDKSLQVYIDKRLERGEEISSALLKAIEESKLSIVVFSKNYASSRWCLDELVHILKCKERDEQIVVPIFYHVTPSDVRKQVGSFGDAFRELEERFKRNVVEFSGLTRVMKTALISIKGYFNGAHEECFRSSESDKLTKWRTALTSVGDLSGWPTPLRCDESELIEEIINDILKKLNYMSLSINLPKGLVGMERRIKHLESLFLTKSSSLDSQIVGIWGMGGIGKTTLAHALFTQIYNKFEGHCFLENIREEWKKHNKLDLRNKLYGDLLKEGNRDLIINKFVKDRLSRRKVLIVLDDLDDTEQFEYLIGDHDWLSHGSRVIVTSRNKQMLKIIGVDWIHMVEQLDNDEALQLFSFNAFKIKTPPKNYMELSRKVVNYAAGMPLGLKVIGSSLFSKNKKDWDKAIKKFEIYFSNLKIQDVLRISYDGLNDHEKDAFLDIACFLKGKRIEVVEEILDGCGFKGTITNLIDMSLISVTNENKIWMHDLVQQMGREIVREQSPKELGKRSRLWLTEEVCRVLQHNLGTSTIEGLSLYTRDIKHDIDIKPSTFNEMYNLRLLKIIVCMGNYKLRVLKGLDFLPDALRYLKWVQYPLKSLPSTFIPHNLVKLDMPLGEFEHLWNGLQHVDSLKYVKLCFSKKLYNAPNLSRANLKSADFEGCTSLVEAPSMRFQQLETNNNKVIMNQITSKVWSQREDLLRYGSSMGIEIHENSLNLCGCSNLKTLSHLSGNIEYIYLRSTAIEVLHHSIWCLGHLSLLDLNNCRSLKNLPKDMICKLECLKELNLGGCVCINMFPKLPKNIVKVDLSGTSIEQVPSSSFDYCFYSLEVLSMKNCTQLGSITTSLSKLKMLNYLDISYCSKLKCFPHITEPQVHLAQLYLDGSGIEEIHWSIKKLIGLRKLDLRRCKNLKSLPIGIFCMNHFEYLYLPERSEMGSSSFLRFEYQYYRDAYDIAKKSISNPFQITNYSEKGYIHPVDQIPFCIPNQSEGLSMDFKFSSTQLDETISITLALCIVVEFVELRTHDEMMNQIIRCESHFIKHDNTTRKCVFVFPKQANHAICFDSKKYLFVWYVNEMCSYIHDTVKVSFDFSIIDVKGKQHQVGKIKRCGIHVYDNNEKIYHNYFPLLLFISKERNGNHFDMPNRKGMKSPSDIITIAQRDRLGNEEPF